MAGPSLGVAGSARSNRAGDACIKNRGPCRPLGFVCCAKNAVSGSSVYKRAVSCRGLSAPACSFHQAPIGPAWNHAH